MIAGSLEDPAAINRCVEGVYGVFSVHPGPLAPDQDEVKAGKAITDAAVKYCVTHLIYSSGLGADRGGQPAKWEIEQYIAASDVSATVLRPSSFMENLITQSATVGVRDGALRTAAAPHVRQQFIALDDIGASVRSRSCAASTNGSLAATNCSTAAAATSPTSISTTCVHCTRN